MSEPQQTEWMARVMVYHKRGYDVYPYVPDFGVYKPLELKDEMMRLLVRAKDHEEAEVKTKCFFDKMSDVTYSILAVTPF